MRVAEIDQDSRLNGDVEVSAHLDALIPRDRAGELSRQPPHGPAHRRFDVDARSSVGQMQKQRESRRALDERADRAATTGADDEVSLSVARDRTVLHLGWSITDHHHVGDPTTSWSRLTFSPRGPERKQRVSSRRSSSRP